MQHNNLKLIGGVLNIIYTDCSELTNSDDAKLNGIFKYCHLPYNHDNYIPFTIENEKQAFWYCSNMILFYYYHKIYNHQVFNLQLFHQKPSFLDSNDNSVWLKICEDMKEMYIQHLICTKNYDALIRMKKFKEQYFSISSTEYLRNTKADFTNLIKFECSYRDDEINKPPPDYIKQFENLQILDWEF